MKRKSNLNEEELLRAILQDYQSPVYGHTVFSDRILLLTDAIENVLGELPLTKGKKDLEPWARWKLILQLTFGLTANREIILSPTEISQRPEFEITKQRVEQIVGTAIGTLRRHASSSNILKLFIVPPPEKIFSLKAEIRRLREENCRYAETNKSLRQALIIACGLTEEKMKNITPENLVSAKDIREDREAFNKLKAKYPNAIAWNALGRNGIDRLSYLKELVNNGELKPGRFPRVGNKTIEFVKTILETEEGSR